MLDILIPYFLMIVKNIRLKLLKLDKTSKIHILE
jgi:hypothetical protein